MNTSDLIHIIETSKLGRFTVTDQTSLDRAFSVLTLGCAYIALSKDDTRAPNGELGVKMGDVIVGNDLLSYFRQAIDTVVGGGTIENVAHLLKNTVEEIKNPKPKVFYRLGEDGKGFHYIEGLPEIKLPS